MCLVTCVAQMIVFWLVLRPLYCELLRAPPMPFLFTFLLAAWIVLDIVQVSTAHQPWHAIPTHGACYAGSAAMLCLLHGMLTDQEGIPFGRAALVACALFLASAGALGAWMAWKMALPGHAEDTASWIVVEYLGAVLLTAMHCALGAALLPPQLVLCVRGCSVQLRADAAEAIEGAKP
eukprot:gnl/TRDRNA2_/TRDRNA2_144019_c0_seq1.p1 gnl/TRDRNA2_/TRDRNA2_144019_c0~~gnl/TRDRNA2_/TRDRNA2_144019_c0_seq1.p1  ORF type:complete len:190 (+),score=21.96 gnl/TRDRNA2_/TRDRNA2_144019_c0_seq1:39-572(+)